MEVTEIQLLSEILNYIKFFVWLVLVLIANYLAFKIYNNLILRTFRRFIKFNF